MNSNDDRQLDYNRRIFLQCLASAGVVGSTGCVDIWGDSQPAISSRPTIDSFVVSGIGESNANAVFEARWAVSSTKRDLESLEIILSDTDTGTIIDSVDTELNGSHEDGVTRLVTPTENGSGDRYEARLIVTNTTGYSKSATATVTETDAAESGEVEKWGMLELDFCGPSIENPYQDVVLSATFVHDHSGTEYSVSGFWDGGNVFKIRFMPDLTGDWSWQTTSNVAVLDGLTDNFTATTPTSPNHGPVVVDRRHFRYADGTRFYPFGTTCYGMAQVEEEKRLQTYCSLDTFGSYSGTLPFNKVRVSALPHEPTSQLDPDNDDYRDRRTERLYEDDSGKDRVNPEWFQLVDRAVKNLSVRGIQIDLILFHLNAHLSPGDFSTSQADKLTEYIVARYGAFRNVWWCLSNEWNKTDWDESRWHDIGRRVRSVEFYPHLASIHTWPCDSFGWDADWVTHVSAQRWQSDDCSDPALLRNERAEYGKPYINDEYQYDGDKGYVFETENPKKTVSGHWKSMLGGAYATHGETYDQEFFRGGGRMHAPSTERIAFMRWLYLDTPAARGFEPIIGNEFGVHKGERYYLFYYGKTTASTKSYDMPAGNVYSVDVIDTWNMTIDSRGEFANSFTIEIPADEYIAVRMARV